MGIAITGGLAALLAIVVAILLGVLIAKAKKRVDKDEDECEQMAGIFQERIHWPEMADVFRKLGRFNLIGAIKAVKIAWKMFGGEKIWILVTKQVVKGIPAVLHNTDHEGGPEQRKQVAAAILAELPALMDAKDTAVLFDDAIFTQATGLALDATAKSNLVLIASGLSDWGLDDTASIIRDFTDDTPQLSKAVIASVANDLSTEAGRVSRAKKVLRKLVPHLMEDPDNAAWLKSLVTGAAPAAAV